MNHGGWMSSVTRAVVLLVVIAIAARFIYDLLRPLKPVLVGLLILLVVIGAFLRRHPFR